MLRSMFSGVSGLRSHQTMMDVIGNNIANVNTVGYKASTAIFSDLLSQTLNGAGVATAEEGGTNPAAVGLGVRLAGITTNFTQGAAQLTGRATDLSIQGDGFFVVERGGQQLFTRAGSLSFDALGRIVTPDGGIVQGWPAEADGSINTNATVGNLSMPLGQNIAPRQSSEVNIGGNLDASAAVGTVVNTSIEVFDQQGTPFTITLSYEKTAADAWTLTATQPDPDDPSTPATIGSIDLEFDPATGALTSPDPTTTPLEITPTIGQWADDPATAADETKITLLPGASGDPASLTQFSGPNGVQATAQNGYALGALQSFTIGADGIVTGVFSNGRNRPIGQIALSTFSNPAGLEKVGDNLWRTSPNSGLAQIGVAGAGGRGSLSGSTLEMSNVDLAREFTNLIIAQRGFQANSRVISASDELLQDLVNLKR
jgi:flagellar hook protein FlgE